MISSKENKITNSQKGVMKMCVASNVIIPPSVGLKTKVEGFIAFLPEVNRYAFYGTKFFEFVAQKTPELRNEAIPFLNTAEKMVEDVIRLNQHLPVKSIADSNAAINTIFGLLTKTTETFRVPA